MAGGGKKAAIGLGVGCLLLVCCGGLGGGGYYYWRTADARAVDPFEAGATDFSDPSLGNLGDVSWGQITLASDPTHIYAEATSSSEVIETRDRGTKVDYYGLDPSASFFKVKASAGADGYVLMTHAEMGVHQEEKLRVITSVAMIYTSNDSESEVLEAHRDGDRLDWYGYDSTMDFYKVQTTTGVDGYMAVVDATIVE